MAIFIAHTVPVEKAGMSSPLLDAALKVGEPASTEDRKSNSTPEPATGSFERFMGTFGPRMAG